MKSVWIVSCCVLLTLWAASEGHLFVKDGFVGIGLDLSKLGIGGKCPPSVNATCPCGFNSVPFNVTVPICSYSHRWKVKCKPCNNLKEEDICPKYSACLQCHSDGKDGCASCPEGKFDKWCENDCTCINGGTCEQDGRCTCPDGFGGRNCQKRRGCTPPAAAEYPLMVVLSPPLRPVTAVYSCPQGYELRGTAVSTCLENNVWSSNPPQCLLKCPLLSVPSNGRLTFSANELVEGVTAEVTCNPNHRLIGNKTISCLAGGRWSEELPICDELASCPDPGNVAQAKKTIPPESIRLGGHYIQDSQIQYRCNEGYEQLGTDTIICLYDGTWSDELPSCIQVSTVIPDCFTKGANIVSEEGVSVRIICPPECADEEFKVWGTSIYRQDSSVCQAAIHSSKITNSGGLVAVINNGPYSHFTGSDSNNVESRSFADRDDSFRFDKLPPIKRTGNLKECGKGLVKLHHTCAYISNNLRTYEEAEAVCSNMGLQLNLPTASDDKTRLVTLLSARNIQSTWGRIETEPVPVTNETEYLKETESEFAENCPSVATGLMDLEMDNKNCSDFLNFVCLQQSQGNSLAICDDVGSLANGDATPVGRIDGIFYVGASIEFSCHSLHYLRGVQEISCMANGSWSDSKPTCVKVNACEELPVPDNVLVLYQKPSKIELAQRSAVYRPGLMGSRVARLPEGLSLNRPENITITTSTPEPETVSLPPGLHGIGVRAFYDCESRYYNLIGSRTRRCQGQGEWSGKPPTCIPVCGRTDSPRSPFIVNGNATDIGQWPWQAAIGRYSPEYGQWFVVCGGSLLNERWVITAAHCLTYVSTTIPIDVDKFQVYLGKYHRQDSKDDEYVQIRKIREMHIHPDYEPLMFDADIALVQLDLPVQLNTRVQPVCLPREVTTRVNVVEGKLGVVTGWGMNENNTYSETLQQAVLPVVSHEKCEKGYEESDMPLTVTENMYCAGFAEGKADACSGDSGGPMVFTDSDSKERKWVLEGIVSWGSPQGCGNPKQYGGFTTVGKFLDWIGLYF